MVCADDCEWPALMLADVLLPLRRSPRGNEVLLVNGMDMGRINEGKRLRRTARPGRMDFRHRSGALSCPRVWTLAV